MLIEMTRTSAAAATHERPRPRVAEFSVADVRRHLEFCAGQRPLPPGRKKRYGTRNPSCFMDLQDAKEVTSFFEHCVPAYQVGVSEGGLDAAL